MAETLDHLRMPPHPANRPTALLFLVGICAPLVLTLAWLPWTPAEPPGGDAAEWPARPASVSDLGAWPAKFSRWFSDHYVFRRPLIRAHGEFLFKGVGVSPSSMILLGKDGWWYYADDGAMEDIVSADPMPLESLQAWRDTLEANRAWLASRGIPYLLVIAPDKHLVYPEFLPDTVHPLRGPRLDELVAYLGAHSSVEVMNLLPTLLAAKSGDRLYHRTDTHWNHRGALVGWLQLAAWIGGVRPGFAVPSRDDYVFASEMTSGRDLPEMLGLGHLVSEEVLDARPRNPPRFRVVEPPGVREQYDQARLVTEHPDASLPRIVLFRDSFATGLVPFVAEHCSRCVFLWQKDVDRDVVLAERPDIVIHQIVGRRFQNYTPTPPAVGELPVAR
jgi:alginate O-acetyltransferase complex protein AlgJ